MAEKDYAKTFTSFSGADLVVSFGKRVIGELQSISYAIQRKKAPIYTLGNADPRSFSRGVRGVAGSMVFAVFNRDALIEEVKQIWEDDEFPTMFTAAGNKYSLTQSSFDSALEQSSWAAGDEDPLTAVTNEAWNQAATDAYTTSAEEAPPGFVKLQKDNIMYADMLPPFDAVLTYANEYGQSAFQKIYDIDVLNEGSGVSVDSIVMERQMTFIARRVSPLIKGVYSREGQGSK
jgi:hypothetical protein